MAFKVITTAARSGKGTLSREHVFAEEPGPEALRQLTEEALHEFKQVYPTAGTPVVNVTVRRAT
jgi:hypothetical protein